MTYRLGIDIGGTFTDVVLQDGTTGAVAIEKGLTTPGDPCVGLFSALDALCARLGVADLADVELFVHATTLATNSVLERRGGRVGLVTTAGFRDVLQLQRQKRHELYNLFETKPAPLVPRARTWELDERVAADGEVVRPLDEHEVAEVAAAVRAADCEAVAVCLLHAYVNSAHERRAAELLRDALPGVAVTTSSETAPVIREYERTNTTVVNAYVLPRLSGYLERLEAGLRDRRYARTYYLMHSNGGMIDAETAGRFPVRIIESGPAAGVVVASRLAERLGFDDAISFDMGGTTAKVCVISDGEPAVLPAFEIDRSKARRGSGLPIAVPSVDLIEIGRGGGSIATVTHGRLQVGPESAGSDPGPACYGRGGVAPTVSDADVVLGYIDPAAFLGGRMPLRPDLAEEALRVHVAEPLGLSVVEAAWAVHGLVNANMASAARLMTVEQGLDPRTMAFVAFGGAGPLHGPRIAAELGCPTTVLPHAAGVSAAMGLLVADVTFDVARSLPRLLSDTGAQELARIYAGLEADLRAATARVPDADFAVRVGADLRFRGQGHELTVLLEQGTAPADAGPRLEKAFRERYTALYTVEPAGTEVEVLTWRMQARAATPDPGTGEPPGRRGALGAASAAHTDPAPRRRRSAYFPDHGGWVETLVCDRSQLTAGAAEGPAIIEDPECTILIEPGDRAALDDAGHVVITHRAAGSKHYA